MNLSPIEAHERTIGQVLGDQFAFEIPSYQRPYAWEEDQSRELLNDLLTAMEDEKASGGVYFLGSIVLIKSPNNPQSQVIDGQQRLTTLTILLSILRDLTSDEEQRIDRRSYIYQKANADRGTKERFRLLLRKQDQLFFRKHVQQPGATNSDIDLNLLKGSQYRIAANAKYLRSKLEELSEERRDALVAFIVQRCYLVVVSVPTAEAARRIFTVLNARGLDLTPTDILKAEFLDKAGEQEERLAERWEAIESAVGRAQMVELFGHIRMIYERAKPRLSLEAGFPNHVVPFGGDAEAFISDLLEPIADSFRLLTSGKEIEERFGSAASKAVQSLSRIDNKDWMPPALLRLWKRTPNDGQAVADFLIKLERVAYFLFVCRRGVNDRISRFTTVMDEFFPRHDQNISIGTSLSESEQLEFIQALDGQIYRNGRVCKAVLQRLDEALSTGGASYDNLLSIEHVLPQTVDQDSEWNIIFSDEEIRDQWTHRLANLVLHRVNTRASNWDFERKKKEYFSSKDGITPFVITQEVLRTQEWTPKTLSTRQRRLLGKLAAVWSLDLPKLEEFLARERDLQLDGVDTGTPRGFTDAKLIESKRASIIEAFSRYQQISLEKKSGALYLSTDGQHNAICSISKRYPVGSPYWYGYSPQWNDFLAGGHAAYLILGCMDRNVAYYLSRDSLNKALPYLHRSQKRHWHIMLEENEKGQLELSVPAPEPNIVLTEFPLAPLSA